MRRGSAGKASSTVSCSGASCSWPPFPLPLLSLEERSGGRQAVTIPSPRPSLTRAPVGVRASRSSHGSSVQRLRQLDVLRLQGRVQKHGAMPQQSPSPRYPPRLSGLGLAKATDYCLPATTDWDPRLAVVRRSCGTYNCGLAMAALVCSTINLGFNTQDRSVQIMHAGLLPMIPKRIGIRVGFVISFVLTCSL